MRAIKHYFNNISPLRSLLVLQIFVFSLLFAIGCQNKSGGSTNNNDGGVDPDTMEVVCGDGILQNGELCDTAIPVGEEGACPISCSAPDSCRTTLLSGRDCQAHCLVAKITNFINNDGCCPEGGNRNKDNDCPAVCGNNAIEKGETCDPPGSCPTTCVDNNSCTLDSHAGSAETCNLRCFNNVITVCRNDDGCCPAGCSNSNDNDCSATCGNGIVEQGETCDPPGSCLSSCTDNNLCTLDTMTGSADNCNVDCSFTNIVACTSGDGCCAPGCNANNDSDCSPVCGNGALETGETCDPPGSCPASCDDNNFCTFDTYTGDASTCDLLCVNTLIDSCADGDGCCPSGCNNNNDNDCSANCGNGVIEAGETCDPPGSCPVDCADSDVCTEDTMTGSSDNCNVVCSHADIVTCTDGDGCCAPGCNANNDNDCSPVCGNGAVEQGETCDPSGSCPTSCADGDVCTTDIITGNSSTCDVVCTNSNITTCIDADGCCAPGCNANTDNDCSPVCGNNIVEPPETCDDMNLIDGDGCDSSCQIEGGTLTAYRVDSMYLRDPHLFLHVLFSCYDITDSAPFGSDSVNEQMNDSIQNDTDGDGNLNLSMVFIFRPLDQTSSYSGPADLSMAQCTAPVDTTVCDEDPASPLQNTTETNLGSGTCLAPYPGTTSGYSPAITDTTAPPTCFSTAQMDITLLLSGTPIVLHDAEIAAVYSGDPATSLITGLIRGFMSETEAANTNVDLGSMGVKPLSDLLQPDACGSGDDRDLGLDGTTSGWWFYLNFTANEVIWVGP